MFRVMTWVFFVAVPCLLFSNECIRMINSTVIPSDAFSSIRSLLQQHIRKTLENPPDSIPVRTVECAHGTHLLLYEPLVFLTQLHNLNEKHFGVLSTQKVCLEVSIFLQCGKIELESLSASELFDLLEFCMSADLRKLKVKVGTELEQRLSKLEVQHLGDISIKLDNRQQMAMRDWVLWHLKQRKPNERQLDSLDFSTSLFKKLFLLEKDSHLEDLFFDVLNESGTSLHYFSLQDKKDNQKKMMQRLWEERESTGDHLVVSRDGRSSKFHRLFLNFIPFFQLQQNQASIFQKDFSQHSTNLSMDAFDALMKFIYVGEIDHFTPTDSLELLDDREGLSFYFACHSPHQDEVVKLLAKILASKMNDVTPENCLKTLLFANRHHNERLISKCISVFNSRPDVIEQVTEQFELIEQRDIFASIAVHQTNELLKLQKNNV